MNRKDFFRRLFGTAVVAAVAPSVLADKDEYVSEVTMGNMDEPDLIQHNKNLYPLTPQESYPCTGAYVASDWSGLTTQNHFTPEQLYRFELEQGKISFSEFINKHK